MELDILKELLLNVKNGNVDVESALVSLKNLPYEELGFAKIDNHRALRTGYPEVIYCEGKKTDHIVEIFMRLTQTNKSVLATRATYEVFEAVKKIIPQAKYNQEARTIVYENDLPKQKIGKISVVSAGTADIPIAEEACVTADIMGNNVSKFYDVGVAGIHRLFSKLGELEKSNVIIVVAGMEGALASVVGGLVSVPVIAVPTSVGYGANFGGLSALLTMLNSCASGIGVVNIDNGFGAGCLASKINKLGRCD
jgi:NCAIR mutase (PurE)-related protein